MNQFRKIAVGEDAPDAVTIGIERDAEGRTHAAVWWPSKGDVDADEASYDTVEEAIEAAEAAKALHGFSEVVVTLQSDDLWRDEWGSLGTGIALSEDEEFELARATEASRDA
jgi:hypothetical protein